MIQANECRIGNRLLNCDNEIVIVKELRDEFYLNESGQGQYYKTSNGISLTPEILEKAGFIKDSEGDGLNELAFKYKYIGLFHVPPLSHRFQIAISGKFIPTFIEYLHQLQNIYYSLVGEELEVNL